MFSNDELEPIQAPEDNPKAVFLSEGKLAGSDGFFNEEQPLSLLPNPNLKALRFRGTLLTNS